MQKTLFAILGLSSAAFAAQNQCAPEPAAACYPDDCKQCYCLGPAAIIANAPVCPVTCAGDVSIWVEGLYWKPNADGLEYAIDNAVQNNVDSSNDSSPLYALAVEEFATLVDAEYLKPKFDWDVGFKLGVQYCSPCDGWDIGINWTHFYGRASAKSEAEVEENHVLLPLWSAFTSAPGRTLFATDISMKWKLDLNLVDIGLGRNFWVSRQVTLRPHIGFRYATLNQRTEIFHRGGSWLANLLRGNGVILPSTTVPGNFSQSPLNNEVSISNDFRGFGVRAGFDTTWNVGCGWAFYGNFAASIVYGRFHLDHDEVNRFATDDHARRRVLEVEESFRASRAMLDLGLGLQWATLICDCKYGFEISLGFEQHLFFHQNQMWRVNRLGSTGNNPLGSLQDQPNAENNTGENTHSQRRGNLDTKGWTLKLKFDF